MNTNALKSFAQEARRKLLEQVASKMEYVLNTDSPALREKAEQVNKLREAIKETSKEQVIDKVTYTWFNRFIALRFMDANDYQPIGIRVLTPKDGFTLPELLDEAKQGHISEELSVKKQRIYDLLDGKIPSSNGQNEAFRELLIGACNHLNKVLPFLFERINDYTELLLPDDMISELSIVHDVCEGMSNVDCAEVEIIGWLYQFYISEKKDEVFASNAAVRKEDIPAATQLFTPRWIVEYMVQNTVGKLWLQNRPQSNLREHMPYFIESPSSSKDEYLKVNSVEEITLLDQACGSGHILVYGFELFTKIYEEEGYNLNDIPQLIIEKNLFGFEIDERAAQLSGMALMMKARSYNRRFFRKEIEPNILCYQDIVFTKEELMKVLLMTNLDKSSELQQDIKILENATNYGSLIIPKTSQSLLINGLLAIEKCLQKADIFQQNLLERLKIALNQLIPLSRKYHCIVDNPPYMGGGNMNKILSEFVKLNYPNSKADLMACFMEAGLHMLLPNGFLGMINQHSWMFLSSYEKLREKLIDNIQFDSLLHLGSRTFPEIGGEVVQNASFTFINQKPKNLSSFVRLVDFGNSDLKRNKTLEALQNTDCTFLYVKNQNKFDKIPGSPIGYWLSDNLIEAFKKSKLLNDVARPLIGMRTGDNIRFLRLWQEVNLKSSNINTYSSDKISWVSYIKGGGVRRWVGFYEYLVKWSNNGYEIKENTINTYPQLSWDNLGWKISNERFFFQKSITWSSIGTGLFSARITDNKCIYDTGGSFIPIENFQYDKYLLGFLNSKVCQEILFVLNPTINYGSGTISNLPFLIDEKEEINNLVDNSIGISKLEWDSRENSWDFQQNALIRIKGQDLEEAYDLFQHYWKNKFFELHKNEEELNRLFIEIYALQDEQTPDVHLEDVTILKEEVTIENGQLVFNAEEVFAQFMSYAVGCMFGRYSLEKGGIILANQGETLEVYLSRVGKSENELSFIPDTDNIIPILDDEWFEDDIVGRFYDFLKASFGATNFEKNLAFIEDSLGKDIRKYFVKDFYTDHLKRYKKRPIYWMFSSPKGSFNVLIYMHRYTPDTLNKIMNNYLIEYREKLNTRIEHLDHQIVSGTSAEKTRASKEKDRIKLLLLELQEYEREILRPLAIERIKIDLDEGVLVNYNKFGKAIKEVAGLNDKTTKKKIKAFDWINTEEIR